MKSYYGFTLFDGGLAFASFDLNGVICWFNQYGNWYAVEGLLVGEVGSAEYVPEELGLESVRQVLQKNAKDTPKTFVRIRLQPGQYHPRIWRGIVGDNMWVNAYDKFSSSAIYGAAYLQSVVAAESLLLEVKELFRVLEPASVNDHSYGHRLRELLILLCTEVEACWSGVLRANKLAEEAGGRYTTKHYVRVCTPLRLSEWKVFLRDYPDREFQPFKYWNILLPTASLPWYDSYNKVKHDREGSFARSTYLSVLEAAAALHILQVAQWGPGVFSSMRDNRFSIFYISELPAYELSETYLADPIDGKTFNDPVLWQDI